MEAVHGTTALLLHGWGTAPARLETLRLALGATGLDARHWTYEPAGSIRRLGAELATAIGTAPVHLVGHSLGGLVAASAMLDHGAAPASVTTVNTPWRGTWAAWTARPGDPLGHELRWRSPELDRLRSRLGEHLDTEVSGPRWSVLSALGDLAVPVTGALRVPDGDRLTTHVVPAVGHSLSLASDAMVAAVTERVVQHA